MKKDSKKTKPAPQLFASSTEMHNELIRRSATRVKVVKKPTDAYLAMLRRNNWGKK